ncbi:imidazoleglycerol-phosphate dehydratase [Kroppenstedtia guangzhouensis]|jgi:imidazoleglycerol-phosphate dehydratase|uniref:Imidazoleglycerol-phosphate dehydratase n=1 Tax=Kroppenstedtia guangzhouensis TaxID=1274356 RepID=A0ABQ1GJ46_9BACL|nr:imidazoleglycerol-phosphate dehydratase HisB [Kroppenstedtia guangzhouensis]GGA44958.1 imidazoleglycerol-phosphate dehydratase [Kroppenstedtia guangzhouensis]
MGNRSAEIRRETKETRVRVRLDLDGRGKAQLKTGVPFLEHMLDLFCTHGLFDLLVEADGDIEVDDHHTVEDIAICLGQAIREALGDKSGIRRYGQAWIPMDESLGQVVLDLSNRPHLEFRADFPAQRVGCFDTELVHEFFWKLALEARMNLHVILHYGGNTHHRIEALFKALGRALDEAVSIDSRVTSVPSSKGVL